MAQHDYVIANGTGAAVRSDLNNALAAIVSNNSGATEPATMYAYQWWADTTTGLLKLRNGANNAWITLRELDGTLTIEAGTVSAPGLAFASDLNTGVWSPGADQFAIATNGIERVEWGTSEVVFNDGGENYDFRIEGDTNSSLFFVDASADTVEINGDATITDKIIHSGDTNTAIRFPAADTVSVETGGSERCRVDDSGRLLVGTSSARANFYNGAFSAALQIEGASGDSARLSIVRSDGGGGSAIILGRQDSGAVGGNTAITAAGSYLGAVSFQGNDGTEFVEAASISCETDATCSANDMPGRLVFSTTADGASSPTERMRISNNGDTSLFVTNGSGLQSRSSAAAGTAYSVLSGWHSATSTTNGTASFVVYTNGNVQNTNNSYGSLSDIKLKENIVDATSQWDDLKALQVRKYNFKEGQTHTQIGLVAQEVELVSPGLVSESPDRDEDGNDLGTVTKSVNYSVLYMKAVKALQEAMERIETLEAKVAALESA